MGDSISICSTHLPRKPELAPSSKDTISHPRVIPQASVALKCPEHLNLQMVALSKDTIKQSPTGDSTSTCRTHLPRTPELAHYSIVKRHNQIVTRGLNLHFVALSKDTIKQPPSGDSTSIRSTLLPKIPELAHCSIVKRHYQTVTHRWFHKHLKHSPAQNTWTCTL